jgi:diaminopropionate ammonia-lyase
MARFAPNPYLQSTPQWGHEYGAAFDYGDTGALHSSLENYSPTPLVELPVLAARLGLGRILVKDEAHRFGLKAFKALGATYAIYRHLQSYLLEKGCPCPEASEFYVRGGVLGAGDLTFSTATDGNHGRGVAWTARLLNQKAVIYMPTGSVAARIENIRSEGAEVVIVEGTYDDAVTRCAEEAAAHGWHIISDTSWPDYDEIPRWIMAGYLTLFREIVAASESVAGIDLVIIPGGVGALAGAAAWFFHKICPPPRPKLLMVEPEQAACLLESIESPGGNPTLSRGRQDSIMAGLNCGYPSPMSWPLIKAGFDMFITISDARCVDAMRAYFHAEEPDPAIVSGESGASGLAALLTLTDLDEVAEARRLLGLGRESFVLLINTEGDTDPAGFQRLVAPSP